MNRAGILGMGSYIAERVMTNADFEKKRWIHLMNGSALVQGSRKDDLLQMRSIAQIWLIQLLSMR